MMDRPWTAKRLNDRVVALKAENAALKSRLDICLRDIQTLMSSADKLEAENEKLKAERDRLRRALEPFAEREVNYNHTYFDTDIAEHLSVTVGDLRAARAALSTVMDIGATEA